MAQNVPELIETYKEEPRYEKKPFRASSISDASVRPFITEEQYNSPEFVDPSGFLAKNKAVSDYMTQDIDRVAGQFMTEPAQESAPQIGLNSFGGNAALYSAIQKRSGQQSRDDIDKLKKYQELRAPEIREQALIDQYKLEFQDYSLEQQKYIEKKKRNYAKQQARRQSRAAVIGTVFGIAGAVGGAVVGGPVGAAAGYAVGSGVGQAIGGQ